MNPLRQLRRLFTRGRAAALYHSGMAKAHADDWLGAIADYTAAIQSPKAPRDILALAWSNRALAHAHTGDHTNAEGDLRSVLAMPDAPADIRKAAQEKLARWGKRRMK
jgi:hypothetical protein